MSQTLGILSDSYDANGFQLTGSVVHMTLSRGVFTAVNAALGWPFAIIYNGAVGGTRTDEWISSGRLAALVAARPAYALIGAPTNDIGQGVAFATTRDNYSTILAALDGAGIRPIMCTGGISTDNTRAEQAQADLYDRWVRAEAARRGAPLIDVRAALADALTQRLTSAVSYNESGLFVHPNGVGAALVGIHAARFGGFPAMPSQMRKASSPYNHAFNARLGGDTSGVPDGWTAYAGGTVTGITRSKVARTDAAGSLVQVVQTAAAANDGAGIQLDIRLNEAWSVGSKPLGRRIRSSAGDHYVCVTAGTSSGTEPVWNTTIGATTTDAGGVVWQRVETLNVGDNIVAYMAARVTAATGGCQPRMYLTFNGAPTPYNAVRANSRVTPDANQSWVAVPGWPVFGASLDTGVPIPSGTTSITVIAVCEMDNGVTATWQLDAVEIRKV
jgi:hypothetical protein